MPDNDAGREQDTALAMQLWRSKRPARVTVVCPDRGHRLAAVYDWPGRGLLLCQPPRKWQASQYLDPDEWGDDVEISFPALLESVAELMERSTFRCRCGTFIVHVSHLDGTPGWDREHVVDEHGRAHLLAKPDPLTPRGAAHENPYF